MVFSAPQGSPVGQIRDFVDEVARCLDFETLTRLCYVESIRGLPEHATTGATDHQLENVLPDGKPPSFPSNSIVASATALKKVLLELVRIPHFHCGVK